MYTCPVCGTENQEDTAFCTNCGAPLHREPVMPVSEPVEAVPAEAPTLPVGAKVMGIISMVLGIVSLVSCYAGMFLAIPALILSSISSKQTPAFVPNSKAKVGKITGIIGLILGIIWFIVYIVIVARAASVGEFYY